MPAKSIIGKQLEIHGRSGIVYGVSGMKADHLQTPEEQKKAPPLSRLLMDIGCTCREEAAALVQEGNTVIPLVEPELLGCPVDDLKDGGSSDGTGNQMMTGRGLAARSGCAVLLELLKEEPACDCWFVFSVSGENWSRVPGKGAMLAARLLDPELAIVLGAVDTGEGPGVKAEDISCRCGNGAAISLQDGDFVFDRQLRQAVTGAIGEVCGADGSDIPWQYKWQYNTSKHQISGAGRLASAGNGCRVLPVNLPVRYLNGSAGMCCLRDLESMAGICRVMMEKAGDLL